MPALSNLDIPALLGRLPLFSSMLPEEIERIARGTRELRVAKGDILFHKGDPCLGFHLLLSGQIKLAFTSSQGNEKVVEIITASVRTANHVVQAALLGADIATVPMKALKKCLHHPLTDAGIAAFEADWERVANA